MARTSRWTTTPSPRTVLANALRQARYEVAPMVGIAERVAKWVPRQLAVAVSALPQRGLDATLTVSEQLAGWGFRAVPHLAARQVINEAHLTEILDRLEAAGIREAFVVAGDIAAPVGAYSDSLTLLGAMSRLDHALESIGIAGAVDRRRLLRVATRIGVGESVRFLRKNRQPIVRLALPGGYRPDRLVLDLAADLARPAQRVHGLHVYTLNDLRDTELWRRRVLGRLGVAP